MYMYLKLYIKETQHFVWLWQKQIRKKNRKYKKKNEISRRWWKEPNNL